MHILVIDDDRDSRELIASKLVQMGHAVRLESDGESGLAAALSDVPGLVLLGVMLPKLTGIEVCQKLRDNPLTADVRVMLISSKSQEADVERGMNAGADDYISKPFSLKQLASRVETILAHV